MVSHVGTALVLGDRFAAARGLRVLKSIRVPPLPQDGPFLLLSRPLPQSGTAPCILIGQFLKCINVSWHRIFCYFIDFELHHIYIATVQKLYLLQTRVPRRRVRRHGPGISIELALLNRDIHYSLLSIVIGRRCLNVNGTDVITVRSGISRRFLNLRDIEYLCRVPERAHRSTRRDHRRATSNRRHILLLFAVRLRHQLKGLAVSATQIRVVLCFFVSTIASTHFSNKIK